MAITLTISCCLCDDAHTQAVELREGWRMLYDGIDAENCFCPRHAAVLAFTEAQCPGCVGGWGDCPLWQAFAFTHSRDINDADLAAIESGICPRRLNGTMQFDARQPERGITALDLSNPASPESGAALAQAIREYIARYPSPKAPT